MFFENGNTTDYKECLSESKPFDFFKSASGVFDNARNKIGYTVDRFYSIGGFTIKLQFAGSSLVPLLTPALEHLAIQKSHLTSLTICLWDSESTKTNMPSPPWTIDDYSARGEVREFNNTRFFTACNKGSGALSMIDMNTNTALWWIKSSSNVPFYESGSPLLTIFHWWLQRNGRQIVHAGAIGIKETGVLLVGKGGSGKSTAAIACLNSELFYAGDDYCIISSSPASYVHSIYSSGKLNADHINNFPHLLPFISNADNIDSEKPLIFFNHNYHHKIINEFPIRALFLPRITGLPDTTLTLTSQSIGVMALAPNTLFQLSYARRISFVEIVKFVKQLPCYYLNLGTNIKKIPDVILRYLLES